MSEVSRQEFMPPEVPCVQPGAPHNATKWTKGQRGPAALCGECEQLDVCQKYGQQMANYLGLPVRVYFGGKIFKATQTAIERPGSRKPDFPFVRVAPNADENVATYVRTVYRSRNFEETQLPEVPAAHLSMIELAQNNAKVPEGLSERAARQVVILVTRMLYKGEGKIFPFSGVTTGVSAILGEAAMHMQNGLPEGEAIEKALWHDQAYYDRKSGKKKPPITPPKPSIPRQPKPSIPTFESVESLVDQEFLPLQHLDEETRTLRAELSRFAGCPEPIKTRRFIQERFEYCEKVANRSEVDAARLGARIDEMRALRQVMLQDVSGIPPMVQIGDAITGSLLLALHLEQTAMSEISPTLVKKAWNVARVLRQASPEVAAQAGRDIELAFEKIKQVHQARSKSS